MTRLGYPDTRCPRLTLGGLPSICPAEASVWRTAPVPLLKTACDVAERIGVFAVDLFSKDDDAKRFYLKYGFIRCRTTRFISICRWQLSGRCSYRRRRVRRMRTSRE